MICMYFYSLFQEQRAQNQEIERPEQQQTPEYKTAGEDTVNTKDPILSCQ